MKRNIKLLKLNVPLAGRNAGDTIRLRTDDKGTVLDQYWRRRIADAVHDNCVEVVRPARKEKTKELKQLEIKKPEIKKGERK